MRYFHILFALPALAAALFLPSNLGERGFLNKNGQSVAEPGQVASLTSGNNFINSCLTQNLPITDGKQIATGSCNPAPVGVIPSSNNKPSAKFVFPANGARQ